ncbi:hypothetical protein OGAPHI_002877 [Ogataea philodendri]|uniref:CCHC-type domain-containing protein n=1 Tax=Ogataea philodendri TaxID=1378263 RepID=A0A9P8P801_9ASCO|nr:uncharacterized protein OGAPHI_002877 [Ogataea philodendri]KAH3667228.1 hypothetical protein OGAPHI_002877 [Ogataea philodendri]
MNTEEVDDLKNRILQVVNPHAYFNLISRFPDDCKLKSSRNFLEWKRKFESYLRASKKGLFDYYASGKVVVQGNAVQDRDIISFYDDGLKSLLYQTINDNIKEDYEFDDNGRHMISKIMSTYGKVSLLTIYQNYREALRDDKSQLKIQQRFRAVKADMVELGCDSETVEVVDLLIIFKDEDLAQKVLSNGVSKLTHRGLQRKIFEKEVSQLSQSSAFVADSPISQKKPSCFKCHQLGHKVQTCPLRKNGIKARRTVDSTINENLAENPNFAMTAEFSRVNSMIESGLIAAESV